MLYEKFDIKTFPSETIVFMDGIFMPDLSTTGDWKLEIGDSNFSLSNLQSPISNLPLHIIFIGKMPENFDLKAEIVGEGQKVFLTAKIINEKSAKFNIFIKNTGENSAFFGKIVVQNHQELKINANFGNFAKNTENLCEFKIFGHSNSDTEITATANLGRDFENCESDIKMMAMMAEDAKITFLPIQNIKSIPKRADHSSAIYKPTDAQIMYLSESGLCSSEIKKVLESAFLDCNC